MRIAVRNVLWPLIALLALGGCKTSSGGGGGSPSPSDSGDEDTGENIPNIRNPCVLLRALPKAGPPSSPKKPQAVSRAFTRAKYQECVENDGTVVRCCTAGNPCDWEEDGVCDCDGSFSWDSADCGGDRDECPASHPVDCAPQNGCQTCCDADHPVCLTDCETCMADCCHPGDPCGWGGDGECDCGGSQSWDAADCGGGGDDCPASHPVDCGPRNGCQTCCDADHPVCLNDCETCMVNCCRSDDPCGWGGDGECDCEGALSWDAQDCR